MSNSPGRTKTLASRKTGIGGDPLSHIPAGKLAAWATQAGYESIEDQRRFRRALEAALTFYLTFVAIPAAPQQRKALARVANAATKLRAAFDELDEATRQVLISDFGWPRISHNTRLRYDHFMTIVGDVEGIAADLAKKPKKQLPGQPSERSGARGDHIKNLACAIVRLWMARKNDFFLGEAYKLGKPKKRRAAHEPRKSKSRFHSNDHAWLAEILKGLVQRITANEIDDAAEFARAHNSDWAKIEAGEDAAGRHGIRLEESRN